MRSCRHRALGRVSFILILLAAAGPNRVEAQTCTATTNPKGPSFPGQSNVTVRVFPSFGSMQATVESALSQAIAVWNAGCDGPHLWPEFALGSSTDDSTTLFVISGSGHAPVRNGTCPNGTDSFPPATSAGFSYQGVEYSHGIIVFGQSGCDGALVSTLGLGSQYTQGDNLANLFAHEIGHHVGLGHDSCTGLMSGNAQYLYDGTAKGIAPEECAKGDEVNLMNACQMSTEGGSSGEDCPDDPVGNLPNLCERVPELCRPRGPGGPSDPWWIIPETRPTCTLVTVCDYWGCNTGRNCYFAKEAVVPRSVETSQGPVTSILSPASGAIVSGTVELDGWSRDDDLGVTGTVGFWVDRQSVYPASVSYGDPDYGACTGSSDPNCPYVGFSASLDTTQLGDGPHELEVVTAEAEPELPTPGYAPSSFIVDNTKPNTTITSPSAGATLSGTTQVTVSASDGNGISSVSLYVDGVYQSSDNTAPYAISLDTRNWPDGDHTLKIRGWDRAGNGKDIQITVTFSNNAQPPAVSLVQPVADSVVRGSVVVTASAVVNGYASGSYVEFYLDGALLATDSTAPYSVTWSTTTTSDGAHTLSARGFDSSGTGGAASAISLTVDNTLPTLYVDVPSHLQGVSGTSVRVAGWAIDTAGVVSHTFRINGQALPLNSVVASVSRGGVCSAYPGVADPRCPDVGWRAFFDSTAYPNGSYTLTVTAVDAAGNSQSFDRSFVIDNPPVTLTFYPVADATAWQALPTYNNGTSTTLTTRTTSGGQGAYAFLKFQVSGIQGQVTSAVLTVKTVHSMTDLWLYWLVDSNWTESNLTWNYYPGPGGTLDYTYNLYAGVSYGFNVISHINKNGTYSVGFANSNPTYASIWSRESTYRPVLTVTYQP